MLIHITPRLYLAFSAPATVVDICIEETDFLLRGDIDLVTQSFDAQDNVTITCRAKGQDAIDGVLIETAEHLSAFTTCVRWAINADTVVTHRTTYVVLDNCFDTVTDSMGQWDARSDLFTKWPSRWPVSEQYAAPAHSQPRMDFWPISLGGAHRRGMVRDVLGDDGLITERHETFKIPTIERQRLVELVTSERMPTIDTAFLLPRTHGALA